MAKQLPSSVYSQLHCKGCKKLGLSPMSLEYCSLECIYLHALIPSANGCLEQRDDIHWNNKIYNSSTRGSLANLLQKIIKGNELNKWQMNHFTCDNKICLNLDHAEIINKSDLAVIAIKAKAAERKLSGNIEKKKYTHQVSSHYSSSPWDELRSILWCLRDINPSAYDELLRNEKTMSLIQKSAVRRIRTLFEE